jgi:hypothetical protein
MVKLTREERLAAIIDETLTLAVRHVALVSDETQAAELLDELGKLEAAVGHEGAVVLLTACVGLTRAMRHAAEAQAAAGAAGQLGQWEAAVERVRDRWASLIARAGR